MTDALGSVGIRRAVFITIFWTVLNMIERSINCSATFSGLQTASFRPDVSALRNLDDGYQVGIVCRHRRSTERCQLARSWVYGKSRYGTATRCIEKSS